MQGLDKSNEYFIPELKVMLHGSTLMSAGIPIPFEKHDFTTKTFHFEEK